jgi:hypothetical protein
MAKQCTKYHMNICKLREKEQKTDNSWYFSNSKGHNFGKKNQWTETIFDFDLQLGIANQCTKYYMNIWKEREKSAENLSFLIFFWSPRAITLWKINGHKTNSNLICNLVWQSNAQISNECLKTQTPKKSGKNISTWLTDRWTDRVQACSGLRQ